MDEHVSWCLVWESSIVRSYSVEIAPLTFAANHRDFELSFSTFLTRHLGKQKITRTRKIFFVEGRKDGSVNEARDKKATME